MTWSPRPEEPAPPLGPELRELRAVLGLRQSELAALLGVSALALGQWERGERRPTPGPARWLAWLAEAVHNDLDAVSALALFYTEPAQFWGLVLIRHVPRHVVEGELSRRE
jgi:transcriptional regulator with XRE-family HTH domain